MKNKKEIITKHLELFFDWTFFKMVDMVMVSDEELDYHMFMIYNKRGELLHGFHIERIRYEK